MRIAVGRSAGLYYFLVLLSESLKIKTVLSFIVEVK